MSQGHYQPLDRRPIAARSSRWAQVMARWLAATGVSANAISLSGMLAGVGAGVALSFTDCRCGAERALWLGAAALVLLRLLANMLDGMVALESGKPSRIGELYNEVPDRIADAAVLIGAGYGEGASVALGYLAACVALFVAYIRTVARVAGAPSDFRGPMAKQQRMWTVILAAVYLGLTPEAWRFAWGPQGHWGLMAAALLLVVVGGLLTAARRLGRAAQVLREPNASDSPSAKT